MKKYLLIVLILFPSLIMQAQRIVFSPQWTPNSQFAGYYVAQEKGFYKDAGIEVDFRHPSASYSALNLLIEGTSDIITQKLSNAFISIAHGIPMVHVLQTSD